MKRDYENKNNTSNQPDNSGNSYNRVISKTRNSSKLRKGKRILGTLQSGLSAVIKGIWIRIRFALLLCVLSTYICYGVFLFVPWAGCNYGGLAALGAIGLVASPVVIYGYREDLRREALKRLSSGWFGKKSAKTIVGGYKKMLEDAEKERTKTRHI